MFCSTTRTYNNLCFRTPFSVFITTTMSLTRHVTKIEQHNWSIGSWPAMCSTPGVCFFFAAKFSSVNHNIWANKKSAYINSRTKTNTKAFDLNIPSSNMSHFKGMYLIVWIFRWNIPQRSTPFMSLFRRFTNLIQPETFITKEAERWITFLFCWNKRRSGIRAKLK